MSMLVLVVGATLLYELFVVFEPSQRLQRAVINFEEK